MSMIYLLLTGNLALTLLLEECILLLWFRSKRMLYACLLCNLLTNPALNVLLILLVQWLGGLAYLPCLLVLEAGAILAEGWVYMRMCRLRYLSAWGISAVANVISVLAGMAIYPLVTPWLLSLR